MFETFCIIIQIVFNFEIQDDGTSYDSCSEPEYQNLINGHNTYDSDDEVRYLWLIFIFNNYWYFINSYNILQNLSVYISYLNNTDVFNNYFGREKLFLNRLCENFTTNKLYWIEYGILKQWSKMLYGYIIRYNMSLFAKT